MKITAPLISEEINNLKAGDYVYITGTIYTARDAAHKRMYEAIKNGEDLPINLNDNILNIQMEHGLRYSYLFLLK